MIQDLNKGINLITYNHLNLPTEIIKQVHFEEIDYVYDATGNKLSKEVLSNNSVNRTLYAGNYIYEDNNLKFINHPEGYIEPR